MRQLLRIGLIAAASLAAIAMPRTAGSALPAREPASAAPLPTPQLRRYGVADGMPSSAAYTVVQDRQGYLWIGSADGLARFDGAHFEVYRHDPRDPASLAANDARPDSLSANDVWALAQTADGAIWAGTYAGGLERLRDDRRGFDHYAHDARDPSSL